MSQSDQEWLERLMQIISENLHSSDFLVENLPDYFDMGRTSFYAKVKEITGETPANLLRKARLSLAYTLLTTQSDIRVAEAMHQVGFNDAKHFTHIFKEYFGITPQSLQR